MLITLPIMRELKGGSFPKTKKAQRIYFFVANGVGQLPSWKKVVFSVLDKIGDKSSSNTLHDEAFDLWHEIVVNRIYSHFKFSSRRVENLFLDYFWPKANCGQHQTALMYRCEWRKLHGLTTDARTHRDIPLRNMRADETVTVERRQKLAA